MKIRILPARFVNPIVQIFPLICPTFNQRSSPSTVVPGPSMASGSIQTDRASMKSIPLSRFVHPLFCGSKSSSKFSTDKKISKSHLFVHSIFYKTNKINILPINDVRVLPPQPKFVPQEARKQTSFLGFFVFSGKIRFEKGTNVRGFF